jgi:hypothetical protein
MKKILLFIVVLLNCFIVVLPVVAQSKILINEFLIDPQPQLVEIFNSGTESADISDWIIDDSGGTTFYTIPKNNIIFPNQCLVFSADFNLNKTSADTVRFINGLQQLIDSFSYKSSSGSGVSYYRFPDNDNYWTTGSASLGFNNQINISCLVAPTPTILNQVPTSAWPTITITPIPMETPTLTPIPTSAPQSYNNIYISEAFVNPPTGGKEWIEIYNNNDFQVSLNNWYLDDIENAGSSPKIFSLEINGKSYSVFDLISSMFNNDGDSVRLLDFNKNLKDDFEYQKTEQGKSLGRTSLESDDFCLQEPSKNSANNPCINPTPTITPTTNIIQTKTSSTVKSILSNKPVSINRLIDTNKTLTPLKIKNSESVLGASDELIINSPDNRTLINLLSFLSVSYSLLVIVSVLIKSKVLKKYALAS